MPMCTRAPVLDNQVAAMKKCPIARRIFFQGATSTGEMWNIECSTGESFAVTIENNGQGNILACSMLKMMSKVDCFKTFDKQR
jgi:hypothetical protein